ncbi:MAG TPA: ABC transporter ATP-binding protein [Polyangia bacterium]
MIEIEGLSKRYGDKAALADLSLSVGAGEVFGFLGPNGSGKTTTIRLLMGLLQPSAGRAAIAGQDCFRDAVALKRIIGYLPDEPFLYPYLTGDELLSLIGGLHGFRGAELARRKNTVIERFAIGDAVRAYTVTLSHGTKKRLALAAATLHEPRVLILDEPTNGLDPRAARDMRALLTTLAGEGRTIFLSTHLLESAERLCNRVAIITAGRLRAVGRPDELRATHDKTDASLEELFLAMTEV